MIPLLNSPPYWRYRIIVCIDAFEALYMTAPEQFWAVRDTLMQLVAGGAVMHVLASGPAAWRPEARYVAGVIGVPIIMNTFAARSLVVQNASSDEMIKGARFITETRRGATRSQWIYVDGDPTRLAMAGAAGYAALSFGMLSNANMAQAVLNNLSLNRWNIDRIPLLTS